MINCNDRAILKALAFAKKSHKGQKRRYSGNDYVEHPIRVCNLVARTDGCTVDMCISALLHDVVEDTGITINDIELNFGIDVACIVGWLTDVSKLSDGNRVVRKEIDRLHSEKSPPEAQTIKLADLIDNSESIIKRDSNFAKVFMPEMDKLTMSLRKGDADLSFKARTIVREYYSKNIIKVEV
ncbi:MAG: HD domain-containing protein [Pseudomonadota bacterium]